jgi:T5SS/PEP-CTERM-associated repeat protein
MEQEAVAAEAGEVVVDGAGGALEDSSDLPVGGSGDGVLLD